MGKNLLQQRRGKGTPRYLSPGHRYLGEIKYTPQSSAKTDSATRREASGSGFIVDILHAPGRTAPVAVIEIAGKRELMLPAEGSHVGQKIEFGGASEAGNIVTLKEIPEGTKIFNVEMNPGDGGKICRSSGSFAILRSHDRDKSVVLLPSGQKKTLSSQCLATVGVVAGSGRTEKPFVKAGAKFYKMHAHGKRYPTVRGVAMNPVDHPFGGSAHTGRQKSVSRHASPGRKVGSISPKRTGKRKK